MPQDRRSFIKRFGATLGSLIVSGSFPGCGPKKDKGLADPKPEDKTEKGPSPYVRTLSVPEWEHVRQCWLSLRNLSQDDVSFRKDNGKVVLEIAVVKEHQRLMDDLVKTGQLEASVAEYVQMAFTQAAGHIVAWKMTSCYLGIPFEAGPREDLLKQADVLHRVSGDLDPTTVAKAQAAITQDMAFFEAFRAGNRAYDESLADSYNAGNLKASPEALEAARLLTQLFAEKAD